jgi:hypothetical protein
MVGFGGLVWGPSFEARFSGAECVKSAVAEISALMPAIGEDHLAAGDVYANCVVRVTELVAGFVGERLFLPGEPWPATDDRAKEAVYAFLISSTEAAMLTFVRFCELEAAAILRAQEHVVWALVDELLAKRLRGDGQAVLLGRVVRRVVRLTRQKEQEE